MAVYKEYKKENSDISFCCYSERGIMAYYFFQHLADGVNLANFFNLLKECNNEKIPDDWNNFTDVCIFSEFELGASGFGSPDGAISFKAGEKSYFIFIEAKFNETYEKSCGKLEVGRKGYNSTIKGQLELRYRFAHSLISTREYANGCMIYESPDDYFKKDAFYQKDKSRFSKRHLKLINGVFSIAEKIRSCNLEDIYYLAITAENKNPLKESNLLPHGIDRKKLLWISSDIIKKAGVAGGV